MLSGGGYEIFMHREEMHNLLETWGYIGLLMVLVLSTPKSLGLFNKLFAASENKGGIKILGLSEIKSQ